MDFEDTEEIETEEIKSKGKVVATISRRRKVIVAVSGGFDPIHIGHIRHFKEAKALGDELIVFLQTDRWLEKKKGYVFMPYEEREEIIKSIKYVDKVVKVIDKDETVSETLAKYKPKVFAKGGDRTEKNLPKKEIEVCKKNRIIIVYGVGGRKVQSSSWLVNEVKESGLNKKS